jgi:hypothetical protein
MVVVPAAGAGGDTVVTGAGAGVAAAGVPAGDPAAARTGGLGM